MTKALQELQKELSSASIAIQMDVIEEWWRLKTDFARSIEMGSVYGFFKLSNYPSIIALFKNAVKTGNQQLTKLFFAAKLIDMESLVAGLYPEAVNDKAKDSLFFIGMTALHRNDPLLLDLSFASILESELPSIIAAFKELHIPTLERIDKALAEKLLVYLANKKYLDLSAEASAFPEERRYQQALLLQITDFLLNRQELPESQVKFLQEYNNMDLFDYLIGVIKADHTPDKINTLLDSHYLKNTLEELKLQELNTFFYTVRLKPLLESYKKNLLITQLCYSIKSNLVCLRN